MIYKNFINFIKNRTIELMGLSLIFSALVLTASFFSYSPSDPTVVYGSDTSEINNLFGIYGGVVADFLLQSFGLTSFLVVIIIISWGLNLIFNKKINQIKYKIFCLILCIIFNSIFIYSTYNNSFWLIDNGNSGFVGQIIFDKIISLLPLLEHEYSIFSFLVLGIFFFLLSSSINFKYLFQGFKGVLNFFKKNNILIDQNEANINQSENLILQ